MTEFEEGHYGSGQVVAASGQDWMRGERVRQRELAGYVEVAQRFAPAGPWLDMGCGAGMLIAAARERQIEADGIEPTPDRRAIAQQLTGAKIYDKPVEDLELPADHYAAITLIDVFSHLISPTQTLREMRRILLPGGVVLLHTTEIGSGVHKEHHRSWLLGDHLYFLGDTTIECYAQKLGYELAYRERVWQPAKIYTREHLQLPGPSRAKNLAKRLIVTTPGALPTLRWYALNRREVGNPVYASTLVLRKAGD